VLVPENDNIVFEVREREARKIGSFHDIVNRRIRKFERYQDKRCCKEKGKKIGNDHAFLKKDLPFVTENKVS
jgi:hypothetical protein